VIALKSTYLPTIEGNKIMGNLTIDRNDDQLNPNLISQVEIVEAPSNPNSIDLVATHDKAPQQLNSTTSNTPSVPMPPINNLANLTADFEPSS
ncbi:Hypothetical predicted protein, partial [Olea europaea subsp. europaea]